jgi:prepilin-type N-terminal cleavage/methylation domain-containing protein
MLSQKGFSLVELMIAMSIFGVVMAAVTNAFMLQRRTLSVQEQVSTMTEQAQTSLDLIAREVRSAGMNPLGTAAPTPVTYDINQLRLQSDRNGNGNLLDPDEDVIYSFDGPNKRILRNSGTGNEIVADNIELFQWAYLDQAGVATAVQANIKQLDLTIRSRTARPDRHYSANGGYRTYTLTSRIGLHN